MGVGRALAALLMAAAVAGCATSATNTLSQVSRDALRVDSIEVSFAPTAFVSWGDAPAEAASGGEPATPEARRTFLVQRATPHIKAALESETRPAFRGTVPARLSVTIRRLDVPSAVQRILIGGSNALTADIRVIDGKTGQTLLEAPSFTGVAPGGQGLVGAAVDTLFPDPIDRVSVRFARALKVWLQTGNALG